MMGQYAAFVVSDATKKNEACHEREKADNRKERTPAAHTKEHNANKEGALADDSERLHHLALWLDDWIVHWRRWRILRIALVWILHISPKIQSYIHYNE